jgi:hypothetical protein
MAAVQFYGKEQVLAAAQNMKGSAWAIFSGTSLITKWETKDTHDSASALEQWLEMLADSNTAAVYKIKFFEVAEGKEQIKINEKTVCDAGSFSFKLQEQEQSIVQYSQRGIVMTETNTKLDKIADLLVQQQERILELEEKVNGTEGDEPEEPETLGSILLDAVKNPQQLMNLVNTFKAITGIGMSNNQQPNYGASIGNIPAAAPLTTDQGMPPATEPGGNPSATMDINSPEYQQYVQRLGNAIDILEAHDPKLVEHLEKLAQMAVNNNSQFNWLLKML